MADFESVDGGSNPSLGTMGLSSNGRMADFQSVGASSILAGPTTFLLTFYRKAV